MPADGRALLDAAIILAEVEEMRLTLKNTVVSSVITGLAGVGSFLLLGPAGILLGSTVAGLGVYSYNMNKFKPVFAILKDDLRPQQQEDLINLLKKAFADVDITDAVKIFALLMSKEAMWVKMRNLIITFMLEGYVTGLSSGDVNVEVKKMTESERHQKFTEEFKRLNGLTGQWCPPATRETWGLDPVAPLQRRSDLAEVTQQQSVEAPGTTLPTASVAAPCSFQTSSADYEYSSSSEEEMHQPSVSKTTLKTTF